MNNRSMFNEPESEIIDVSAESLNTELQQKWLGPAAVILRRFAFGHET